MMTGPSHRAAQAPYGGYISCWPPWGAFFRPRPLGVVCDYLVIPFSAYVGAASSPVGLPMVSLVAALTSLAVNLDCRARNG